MKMLKRVGIFPVDQESITLFENIHECRYGEIMHIASIKAWGLCGKKIQRCDGSEIIIEEGIGNIIKECEVLILLESWHDASPEYIKSVVKTAKQKSITIVSINNIRNSLNISFQSKMYLSQLIHLIQKQLLQLYILFVSNIFAVLIPFSIFHYFVSNPKRK